MKNVEDLKSVADEMLGGLTAGESLKRQVYAAARQAQETVPFYRWKAFRLGVPACAMAAVIITAAIALPLREESLRIDTHAAGATPAPPVFAMRAAADLPEGSLQLTGAASAPGYKSLFAQSSGANFPLLGVNTRAYRLLKSPTLSEGDLGGSVGSVGVISDEPSLCEDSAWKDGLSNIADEGSDIRAISGVGDKTAVAAKVDGKWRVFQRVYYAGHGTMSDSLENTLDVRGSVASLELSDVGTISDSDTANSLIATLLDNASFYSEDATGKKQSLTVTLKNGISFTLGVSGDVVSACGGWSCPEFFTAFSDAL